jgi:chemotaxis protein CheD
MDKIIGIGGIAVSNTIGDQIKTFSLASCVAVTVYCQPKHTAGMIHIALPENQMQEEGLLDQPCYYATHAVPMLINKMCAEYGCPKQSLEIELFGGARSVHGNDVFHIGTRNVRTVKSILDKLNLMYVATETGGTNSRTLGLDVATGNKTVFLQPLII